MNNSSEYGRGLPPLGSDKKWLVTGVAGFIGSHLLEALLLCDQDVVGLDNFSTGYQHNLDDVESRVSPQQWQRFSFIKGDVCDAESCAQACAGRDVILHQAALGSVPRSIAMPVVSNQSNVDGFLTLAWAAKEAGVKRFVYASSSSVYGDDTSDTKKEDRTGELLSPYAVTKKVNELYAGVFSELYEMEFFGLRYFNVFGPRQDPGGAYAAVIPKWIGTLLSGETAVIHGDGKTSRDFAYVKNVVQANLRAGIASDGAVLAKGKVANIACGDSTSLTELYKMLGEGLTEAKPGTVVPEVEYGPFRKGDIRHSLAQIENAKNLLGYQAQYSIGEGLAETVSWYCRKSEAG